MQFFDVLIANLDFRKSSICFIPMADYLDSQLNTKNIPIWGLSFNNIPAII